MASDNSGDPITDYSQTERIVLLIDLNPLLHLEDKTPYLTSLLASIETLLSFPPLSTSLFAFRPFFSSLSPLLSSSKLPTSLSLSFHLPNPTFLSLSEALNSLPTFYHDPSLPKSIVPRASLLAASLRQLVHDYTWDPVIYDPLTGMFSNCESAAVRSNLVVLFSPVYRSVNCLSEFLNEAIDDESLDNVNIFCQRFRGFFENVNDVFVSRDIQCCWVDVRYELERGKEKAGNDDDRMRFGFFESAIRSLGWGFSSTDSIILGSALVPFGLIYPEFGISSKFFYCSDCQQKVDTQLSLEILDVSGKPLECKLFDLELLDLKMSPRSASDDVLFFPEIMNSQTKSGELKKMFWANFGKGVTKFQVKALQKYNVFLKYEGHLSDPLLVLEVWEKPRKCGRESSGPNFFTDKVLEMLAMELGEIVQRKSAPIWQILLSFLYRDGQSALVSLSNGSGVSYTGILKPFTVSSALLFIMEEGFYPQKTVHDIGGRNVDQLSPKMNNKIRKHKADLNQTDPATPNKHSADKYGRKRNNKRNLNLLQDLTWSSVCKAAFDHSELGLEEVYFARGCSNLKKLKFLKCWMKQIKKSSSRNLMMEKRSQEDEHNKIEMDRLDNLHQERQQPISSFASVGENDVSVVSGIQDEAAPEFRSETSEVFFSNLSNKIKEGIESEAVDLGALADRLVNLSIYWLNQKRDTEGLSESKSPLVKSGDANGLVAAELLKLLLRDPKDINARHKSDTGAAGITSGKIFREYELQIFFRMEMLQSEVGAGIAESMKQKFVKQICSSLEKIRCHLDGGFFGDWSLDDYVDQIIKSRYCETLGDVVHRIYTKMDLLLFADEEELPTSLLNSEGSNRSRKEHPERHEVHENIRIVSVKDESLRLQKTDHGRPSAEEIRQKEHARKLVEAQQRRERAQRFSSRGVPDLQRVWAPKQPKPLKPSSNPHRNLAKRKEHRESCDDRVCEIPQTGSKRSCPRSFEDDEDCQEYGNQACRSVYKALFQDDK